MAAGPPVKEDHMMIGVTGAAETLYELRGLDRRRDAAAVESFVPWFRAH